MAQPKRSLKPATAEGASVTDAPEEVEQWVPPRKLRRRGMLVVAAGLFIINLPLIHHVLRGRPPVSVSLPFEDDFSSQAKLDSSYWTNGGYWRLVDGQLFSPGVKNNPLWLKTELPDNVAVDFDAKPISPDGDIRAEIYGDGENHLSGYEVVLGGWGNSMSALVRLDESGRSFALLQSDARQLADRTHLPSTNLVESALYGMSTPTRVDAPGVKVEQNRNYHVRLERRGKELRVYLDGNQVLGFEDPLPFKGHGHDRFGLSSAEGSIYFDNLKVTAVDGGPFQTASTSPQPPAVIPAGPTTDDFDRAALGNLWRPTDSSVVSLVDGAAVVANVHNHPVWLARPMPERVSIDFDTWSDSPDGDIKIEAFGDGQSFHQGELHAAYDATGYVFILGGWKNTLSAIVRQEEHGENRVTRPDFRVTPGQHYHWRIERDGKSLKWMVDGKPFLSYDDPNPLVGPSHAYFALSGWETRVHYDNLKIAPL